MTLYANLARNLRAAMAEKDCSQGWLAHRAGYSASYLHRILHGHMSNPTLGFVDDMAAALDLNPLDLLRP